MILNYTPHEINIRLDDDQEVIVPSSGSARVTQIPGEFLYLDGGVPIYGPSIYGETVGLPASQPGVQYLVSLMVAQALPNRSDLLVPGTGPADGAIRQNGQVVAVTRLIRPNS